MKSNPMANSKKRSKALQLAAELDTGSASEPTAEKLFSLLLKTSLENLSKLICRGMTDHPRLMRSVVSKLANIRGFRIELGNLLMDTDFNEWIREEAIARAGDARKVNSADYTLLHEGNTKDWTIAELVWFHETRGRGAVTERHMRRRADELGIPYKADKRGSKSPSKNQPPKQPPKRSKKLNLPDGW